jgi:hypothetical protein
MVFAGAANVPETSQNEWVSRHEQGYSELRNQLVCAADGVDYAYRDTGGRASGCRWYCSSTSAETWTTGTRR